MVTLFTTANISQVRLMFERIGTYFKDFATTKIFNISTVSNIVH